MADINIIPDDNIQEIEVDNAPYQEIVVEQEVIQSIDVYQEQSQTVDIEPTECTGGIALDETCPLKADLEAAVNSKIPKRIGEKLPQAQSLSNMDKLYIESQSNEAQFATLSQLVDFISSGGTGGGGGTDAVRGISSIEKTASAGLVDTYTIYFTDETTQTYTVTNGASVSIVSVITSPSDDGYNIITFSDGNVLSIKNGSRGSRGEQGIQGIQGERGERGEQGIQGIQGERGERGEQGVQGEKGDNGEAGYTPIKGTDYFTVEDKNEIVQLVLEALPSAEEVAF